MDHLLTKSQRSFLQEATTLYRQAMPDSPAEEFLARRGLGEQGTQEVVDKFKLGYVVDGLETHHERYRGTLAIPYLRNSPEYGWAVSTIRFRCVEDHTNCKEHGHPKYSSLPGDRPRLFKTPALSLPSDRIGITEGELDAITAQTCGIPSVGVPGANLWRPHFALPFQGYEEVLIFADGDEAGTKFASTIAKALPNARVVQSPDGHDVSSLVHERGRQYFIERVEKA
jgi:hypothetical protein